MTEFKEVEIGSYRFRIKKLSFLEHCKLQKLSKGVIEGMLIGVGADDFIRSQVELWNLPDKSWIRIPDYVFDNISPEQGDELLKKVNEFNKDFRKVQPNEQTVQS